MNAAHIHLLLNHIPVLGVPFSLLVIAHGLYRKNDEIVRLGLMFLVAVAILTVPAYLTGDPAEDIWKKLPVFEKGRVHPHEEAGEISLVLTSIAGVLALVSLAVKNNTIVRVWGPRLSAFMSVVATISLAYTAYMGGQIRHTEIRGEPLMQQISGSAQGSAQTGSENNHD